MNKFDPKLLTEAVVATFNYTKVPHVFSEDDTKDYTRALLLEAIHLATDNPGEYVEVRMGEWFAQALMVAEDNVLASLLYVTEAAQAVYKEGHYV